MVALPPIQFETPPEPFTRYDGASTCDPEPKPGVVAFRRFLLDQVGGGDSGIGRNCDVGGRSEHHEGRAWDWRMSADDPEQAEQVADTLDWLLANDGEMFRRAGLMYMIWDGQIFTPSGWHAYSRPNPHTDHVHFSFGWPGALAETSFYQWLEGRGPPGAPPPRRFPPWAAALSGAVLGFAGIQLWRRR